MKKNYIHYNYFTNVLNHKSLHDNIPNEIKISPPPNKKGFQYISAKVSFPRKFSPQRISTVRLKQSKRYLWGGGVEYR